MSNPLIIAVDAMGGDHAPTAIIEGAARARLAYPDIQYRFFGREEEIRPILAKQQGLKDGTILVACEDVIGNDLKPSQAVRRGRQSSMGLAIEAVKRGDAQVAVSAGNTGALMALAKVMLRTMDGISRPALASLMPSYRGDSVMLDLGANVECDTDNLVQFAIMGAAFARTVMGMDRPSVGLLNVGVEDLKGHDTVRQAADRLKDMDLAMRYAGFVEGDGIARGDCDVVVTDGFTGNAALKTAEGTAKLIARLMAEAFRTSWLSQLGYLLARRSLNALRNHLDPNIHNGAVFLGLNGLVVKSHGGANDLGIASAIGVAADMARADFVRLIAQDLAKTGSLTTPEKDA